MTTPKKNNYHNTWQFVREMRKRYKNKNNPFIEGLEDTWELIADHQGDISAWREKDESISGHPLDALGFYIEQGYYPPPEILDAIYCSYTHYKSNAGALELEEVFFESRKRGVGNYAAQQANVSWYRHLLFIEIGRKDENITLLAEEMFEQFSINKDIDSFLRSYRRWKKRSLKNKPHTDT